MKIRVSSLHKGKKEENKKVPHVLNICNPNVKWGIEL